MTHTEDFDVSLSFAGDHRDYVELVASGLQARGVRVFYDIFSRAELIGQELIEYLQRVYSVRSGTVAAFISAEWVTRPWPTHERRSALGHALLSTSEEPFVLPFRFDDTPVPGLQPTVAYEDLRILMPGERRWRPDARFRHPRHVVQFIIDVLASRGISATPAEESFGVQVRLIWAEPEATRGRQAITAIDVDDLEAGRTAVYDGEQETPDQPTGSYLLVPARLGHAVDPLNPIPVFLHESYTAQGEELMQQLPNTDPQTLNRAIQSVKTRIQAAVDDHIGNGWVPLGPTLTQDEPHPTLGPIVTGICVVARPRLPPQAQSSVDE